MITTTMGYLALICTVLRYCITLTLFRLVSSAFNFEFGVSRQYLRVLDSLLQIGQRRIERVESKNKGLWDEEQQTPRGQLNDNGDRRPSSLHVNADAGAQNLHPKQTSTLTSSGSETASRPDSSPDEAANESAESAQFNNKQQQQHKPKTRRVSTPDGPPVFLLDDFDSYFGPVNQTKHEFHLADATHLIARGISDIIEDEVTKRFTPEQLKTWNLLTRNNAKNYQFMSFVLGLFWLFGLLVRYTILMPLRILFTLTGLIWLLCTMPIIGILPRLLRDRCYRVASLMAFRMLSCGITSRLDFHNRQYRAKTGDICVANHTSPLDVVLLACDNCYALVGQRHAGLLGLLEFALSRATRHVWFDRSEMRDRQLVTQRLREHITGGSSLPVLIFPEGTCINNSAVMMFRKGSFETTDRVCPVAMKYDPRFGDPFWDSSKQTYLQYLLMMMSSWAIKCDVWYLPPMERLQGESSAEFANRVKAEIAKQAGLPDLAWDGQLKRSAPKASWRYQQQEDFANRLKLE